MTSASVGSMSRRDHLARLLIGAISITAPLKRKAFSLRDVAPVELNALPRRQGLRSAFPPSFLSAGLRGFLGSQPKNGPFVNFTNFTFLTFLTDCFHAFHAFSHEPNKFLGGKRALRSSFPSVRAEASHSRTSRPLRHRDPALSDKLSDNDHITPDTKTPATFLLCRDLRIIFIHPLENNYQILLHPQPFPLPTLATSRRISPVTFRESSCSKGRIKDIRTTKGRFRIAKLLRSAILK